MIGDYTKSPQKSCEVYFVFRKLENPENLQKSLKTLTISYLFDLKVVDQARHNQVFLTYLIERRNRQKALLVVPDILLREQAIYLKP